MTAEQRKRRMAPDARREAILDAAQALFMAHGWEQVTIADVLKAAEISKGGFYHHFSAKEDLLSGIVTRMTGRGLAVAEDAFRHTAGDALARLNAFMGTSVRWKADNIAEMRFFAEVLARPGNDILFRRVFDATAEVVVPVLKRMIAGGAREGTFDVADAQLTAELIVGMANGRQQALIAAMALATSGDLDRATETLDRRMQAEGAICDRLLGLPRGSVPLSNPREYRRMLAGMARVEDGGGSASAAAEHSGGNREA